MVSRCQRVLTGLVAAFGGIILAGVLLASSQAAASVLDKVGTWADSGQEVQLGGVGGLAINRTGAGGVPEGTVYGVTRGPAGGDVRVSRYTPKAGGVLEFSETWVVKSLEEPYERCGPNGDPSSPICPIRAEAEVREIDVEVDQNTGNVLVANGSVPPGRQVVVEYSPDGSEVLSRFAEKSASTDTVPATPTKVHVVAGAGGLAVNDNSEVFIYDNKQLGEAYHRLMVFKPELPDDVSNYEYAGEIAGGVLGEGNLPSKPITDDAGNIYVAGESYVEMYAPEAPGTFPHHSTPVCTFNYQPGGITAITVNPNTGQPFFFSYKKVPKVKLKLIHQLSSCVGGEFKEVGTIEVDPELGDLWGLAFDPGRQFSAGRQPGVLYGAAPGPVPSSGVGAGDPSKTSLGYAFAPAEESPAVIEDQSVDDVTATGARLRALINPRNFDARYSFQYISDAGYIEGGGGFAGASEVPLGGASLGAGSEPIAAAATLTGLIPDIGYHYRVAVTSNCSPGEPTKVCEVFGPDQFFRTYPFNVRGLPDGRAYELVSPAEKNGGQVLPAEPSTTSCKPVECKPGDAYQHFPMQSSPNGEAVVYEGSPFFPGQGAVIENEYISRHSANGWSTANLTPGQLTSKGGQGYKAFDTGLSRGILEQIVAPLSSQAPAGFANLYLQPTSTLTSFGPLLQDDPPPANHLPFNRQEGEGSGSLVLSYAGASADLSRVFFEANDGLTGADAFAPESADGGAGKNNLYEWSAGQLSLVNVAPLNVATAPGAIFGSSGSRSPYAISANGSHVYWSSEAGQLYVRIDGTKTREIKAPGKFLTASADGSKVLLNDGCLYGLAKEECEDLTAGKEGFLGIAGQSEDLSRLYFVDAAVLTGEEENDWGAKAQPTQDNLYAWEDGSTSFVATLLPGDSAAWRATPAQRMAEASPSGRWLTFLSKAPLTEYDNNGPCELTGGGEITTVLCGEAFLYDSSTGGLVCASCSPANARPLGRTVLRLIKAGPSLVLSQPRYLTDSGRLYFDTQDSLTPADTNGNVEDVYQFEPAGLGGCFQVEGCVSLISGGREGVDSNFLAMDEKGDNIFFTSRDQLVPADTDELIDLYDARVGGESGGAEIPPKGCGEGCQPSTSSAPEPPSSSTVPSSGNVKPSKSCKKGQVMKKGRCVKKPKQAKKKHKAKRAGNARGGAK